MNRLKFRAWDELNKQWLDGGACDLYAITLNGSVINRESAGSIGGVKVVQSTGLKDKNGVEIYEGDIINSDNIFMVGEPLIVEFSDGCYFGKRVSGNEILGINNLTDQPCEVIGNIYQHPELLENNNE